MKSKVKASKMIPVKLSVKVIADKQLRFFMIDEDHKFYSTSDLRKVRERSRITETTCLKM